MREEKENNQLVSEKYSGKNYFEAIILVSTKQDVFRHLRFTIFFTTSKRKKSIFFCKELKVSEGASSGKENGSTHLLRTNKIRKQNQYLE